jgi:hypothetical protein
LLKVKINEIRNNFESKIRWNLIWNIKLNSRQVYSSRFTT